MTDRIASEWRQEEPHGSVYPVDHKTRSGTEKRWYAQFRARDYTGKQRTYRDTRSTTKRAAQRALSEIKERALANKQPPAARDLEPQTISAYLDQWHEHRVETGIIGPSTAEDESRYIKILAELIGATKLRELTPTNVEMLVQHLQTDRLKGKHRSIQLTFRCLRKAMSDVRPRLDSNPCDAVDRPRVAKPDTRTFTPEELQKIVKAADQPAKRSTVVDETFSALVSFLAHSGCRINEALGLTWGDVDFDAGRVHIRKALKSVKGEGVRRIAPKTTAGTRAITLSGPVMDKLRRLRGMIGAVPHGTKPVFASETGGPLRDSTLLRRRWHPLLAVLGLEKCGFHRLRHTFASVALQEGLDIGTVSKILGHANPAITLSTYAHFLPGREQEAADAVASIVAGEA